jgi:hypothetical protein
MTKINKIVSKQDDTGYKAFVVNKNKPNHTNLFSVSLKNERPEDKQLLFVHFISDDSSQSHLSKINFETNIAFCKVESNF